MQLEVLKTMVQEKFNAPDNFLKTKRKLTEIVWPRHVMRYILRDHFGLPHRVCAKLTGASDHSTNIHSMNAVQTELYKKTKIGVQIEQIKELVKAITDKENNPNGYGFPTLER